MRAWRAVIVVSAAFAGACDSSKPPAPDPWASPAKPAGGEAPSAGSSDPWGPTAGEQVAPSVDERGTNPASNPPTPSGGGGALPDGDWKCELIGTVWMNGGRYTQTMNANGFTIRGNAYTSSAEGEGTVEFDGTYATFHGGGFGDWRGALNAHKDGTPYLVFGGASHRDAQPGHGAHVNDIQCEPAR